MNKWWILGAITLVCIGHVPADDPSVMLKRTDLIERGKEIRKLLDQHTDNWLKLYQHLHANPELSTLEVLTAKRLAGDMRSLGFDVTENVGGTGIVCVFKNGLGPTILVRTDLDGLPVEEKTGVPYASKQQARDREGKLVPTMHACGHDMHMTVWFGTAQCLVAMKDKWQGTLMFIGQPAEEIGTGAKAMLKAGLFEKFGKPTLGLALHCDSSVEAGQVVYTEGMALANVDSVDITFLGKGGHGSQPHKTIDPILIASRFVVDVQALVSREIDPQDAAVVTVGSFHAGFKHNIIPAEANLLLTVRSFNNTVRNKLLTGIERMANAASAAADAPKPTVKFRHEEFTASTYNDPVLTRRVAAAITTQLGSERVKPIAPLMGGEDFGRFGDAGIPICMFRLGTVNSAKYQAAMEKGQPLPSIHSDFYAPDPEPSLKTGVLSMTTSILNEMPSKTGD